MKSLTLKKTAARDSYMGLIQQFPLRPIRNRADYAAATTMVDQLAAQDESKLDRGEADYLDVLGDLIESYEAKHATPTDPGTPAQRLRRLMESSGTSATDLAKILGVTRPLVSMVLSGKRALSTPNIRKLAERFHLEPGYFI
ncbi:MAG: helix-turn-helix domain-containing protein [Burkholderiales bacterium]|nr:helix-turn-helix domain-containing protein [Phycisphaerae bacterium]